MKNQTIAITVFIVAFILGAGIFIAVHENSNNDADGDLATATQIISRVNTDGSGIYMKKTYESVSFFDSENNPIKEAWEGKVFGTPGTASIQHVQLQSLVTGMGFNFVKYDGNKSSGNVYYIDNVTNADAATGTVAAQLDGGILWEPQYSKIIASDSYYGLKTTNELFPGHTCCIIAGSENFLKNNSDTVVAFLAGYNKGVKWVNNALADKTSDEYNKLIEICRNHTSGLTDDVIKDALSIVKYVSADDATGSLSKLKTDVASLEESLKAGGNITKDIKSYGFSDSTEFANAFVNDTYLKKALSGENVKLSEKKAVRVAAIEGDIHQIALHVANELGFFEEYNVEVNIHSVSKGPTVALEVVQGKETDLGFVGAPPMTINTVNTEGGIHR